MSILQALILGLLQGLTELFPISSLGHSVIVPALFGWNIQQDNPYFLDFLIATHLATAVVLFIFFWRDWALIIRGLWRSIVAKRLGRRDTYAKLGWLLIAGTIPAGLLGLGLEHPIRELFKSAQIAAAFLMINGIVLFAAEYLRKRSANRVGLINRTPDEHITKLSVKQAVLIGAAQSLALLPGISRSGASMAGGLLFGLNNEQAARFSFLLATPIIGAAAVLKLPELTSPEAAAIRLPIIVGAICAGLTAYFSVRFLTKYFQKETLKPFAVYCLVAGAVLSVILFLK
jgi:undecaprenyl-diphosphatase